MTPRKAIVDLWNAGYSEQRIVDELLAMGVRTTQPTINRIKRGTRINVPYELGTALIKLHGRMEHAA